MDLAQAAAGERIYLPDAVGNLTTIDLHAECDPTMVGMSVAGINRIWSAVESLYKTGLHPSITLVIRRHGRIVMKRSIGCIDPQASVPVPLSTDTPQCIFSASKVVTALLVHKLVEDGAFSLDDCVSRFIPEFARNGKRDVTVRDLLAHRAGVPFIPPEHADTSLLHDWDRILKILCEQPRRYKNPAVHSYHALTSGYVAGEIVRRVSGMGLATALRQWIAEPLGCRYLTYGLDPAYHAQRARNAFTGPNPVWPITWYFRRMIGSEVNQLADIANSEAFLSAVIPAGNIHASGDDLSRVFEMLRCGGVFQGKRVLQPDTVRALTTPVGSLGRDRTIQVPIRYSPGCMLGESPVGLYGPGCSRAFGHLGFMSILGWADPQRAISVSLLNTGKSIAPAGFIRMAGVLWAISRNCKAGKQ